MDLPMSFNAVVRAILVMDSAEDKKKWMNSDKII